MLFDLPIWLRHAWTYHENGIASLSLLHFLETESNEGTHGFVLLYANLGNQPRQRTGINFSDIPPLKYADYISFHWTLEWIKIFRGQIYVTIKTEVKLYGSPWFFFILTTILSLVFKKLHILFQKSNFQFFSSLTYYLCNRNEDKRELSLPLLWIWMKALQAHSSLIETWKYN